MKLKEWLKDVKYELSSPSLAQEELKGDLALTSLKVKGGDLFLALPGERTHGSRYARDALSRGAVLVVSDLPPPEPELPWVVVPELGRHLLPLVQRYYPVEWKKIYTAAVTGTNGKSSIVYMLAHMMRKAGYPVAYTGTIEYRSPGGAVLESWQTTPHFVELYRLLSLWQREAPGTLFYAYEASSHALEQERLKGIPADGAIITAITHDHLDYHKTYEAYRAAKLKLVAQEVTHPPGVLVYWGELPLPPTSRRTLGVGKGKEVEVLSSRVTSRGVSGTVRIGKETLTLTLPLLGSFQLENAAYAMALLNTLFGIRLQELALSLNDFVPPPGRMEPVCLEPFGVVVDYAHTPEALKTALSEVRALARGKVIAVFGCGGDRDREKRPEMGRIAGELADLVILTSDNPRSEDPERIIAEIAAGVPASRNERIRKEVDRSRAIALALSLAEPGDFVLIAGKGHEQLQVAGDRSVPFSDVEEAKRWLKP